MELAERLRYAAYIALLLNQLSDFVVRYFDAKIEGQQGFGELIVGRVVEAELGERDEDKLVLGLYRFKLDAHELETRAFLFSLDRFKEAFDVPDEAARCLYKLAKFAQIFLSIV